MTPDIRSKLNFTVVAADPATERKWSYALAAVAAEAGLVTTRITLASEQGRDPSRYGELVFVDAAMPALVDELGRINRRKRAVFVLIEEARALVSAEGLAPWIHLVAGGQADDLLLAPFRSLELLSKVRHYQQLQLWEEVAHLNASFSTLLERVREDVRLAERIQKSRMPLRFADIKGFRVASRYLAGLRSGGDHFDLAEAPTGQQLALVLSDSSSYGLSSALLSVLMRVALKLTIDETRSCEETVRRIHEELLLSLGEKDRLSLFYGVVSRKDYRLRYVNLGASAAFYAPPDHPYVALPSQGPTLGQGSEAPAPGVQTEVELQPGGRLALVSDGFIEATGGSRGILSLLNRFRQAEPADSLNELVFQLKSKLSAPDDLPEQDCTAIVLDVDARILRQIG